MRIGTSSLLILLIIFTIVQPAYAFGITASDTIQNSSDSQVNHSFTTVDTKVKSFIINNTHLNGTMRVVYDDWVNAANTGEWSHLAKNSVTIGNTYSPVQDTWTTRTQDLAVDLVQGDSIDLYVKSRTTTTVSVRNFRIEYNVTNNISTTPQISSPSNASRHYNNSINVTWNQSTDADSDPITYHYQLSNQSNFGYIVNQSNRSQNWTGNIATTDGITYFSRVRSNDSYEYSSWSNVTQFTENTKPTYSNVSISPSLPSISSNLTAFYNISDPEGDAVSPNITLWYKDNALQTSLNNTSTVVAVGNTSAGETWKFTVYGNDGYEDSITYTSSEVIIGSTNSPPNYTSIILTPPSRKYNQNFSINVSGIQDDSSTWQIQTYWKHPNSTKVYLGNSSWSNTSFINISVTNPFTDGLAHNVFSVVYDSGNASGLQNLSSSENYSVFTSSITPATVPSSSLSASSITVGGSVTVTAQIDAHGANVSTVSVQIERPDAVTNNWSMSCGSGENVSCTKLYTSTSDVGTYYIRNFFITDDSEIDSTVTSSLSFNANAVSSGGSGGGGGSGSTVLIVESLPENTTNLSKEVSQLIEFSPYYGGISASLVEEITKCYKDKILLNQQCAKILISSPTDWVILVLATWVTSIVILFGLSVVEDKPRSYLIDSGLYSTLSIMLILFLNRVGINAYIWSYLMESSLPAYFFLSAATWSVIVTIASDHIFNNIKEFRVYRNKLHLQTYRLNKNLSKMFDQKFELNKR